MYKSTLKTFLSVSMLNHVCFCLQFLTQHWGKQRIFCIPLFTEKERWWHFLSLVSFFEWHKHFIVQTRPCLHSTHSLFLSVYGTLRYHDLTKYYASICTFALILQSPHFSVQFLWKFLIFSKATAASIISFTTVCAGQWIVMVIFKNLSICMLALNILNYILNLLHTKQPCK